MSKITLISSDGKQINVDVDAAKMSATIKTMLEDLNIGDGDDEAVPLPNVDDETLELFIKWAEYHKADPPAPEDDETKEKRTDDISRWDEDFLLPVPSSTFFKLMVAANYLDVKGLLDLTCKKVASMIKGKTPEEIQKRFKFDNDFTETEQGQISKKNNKAAKNITLSKYFYVGTP